MLDADGARRSWSSSVLGCDLHDALLPCRVEIHVVDVVRSTGWISERGCVRLRTKGDRGVPGARCGRRPLVAVQVRSAATCTTRS